MADTSLYSQKKRNASTNWKDSLDIECTKEFKYKRNASLNYLVNLARSRHYSTFSLYQKDEFETALKGFEDNIKKHFSNLEKIEWDDEYTMLVTKKCR